MRRRTRLTAAFLIASVTFVDLACFALNVSANRQYIADGPWAVAQYAEPYRSLFVLGSVLGMSFLVRRAYTGTDGWLRRVVMAVIASAVSVVVSIEAGMGVLYHPITGELSITAFPWTRGSLQLPRTEDGVCVRPALDGFYTWYLNGTPVHPRLLPLPLDAQELKKTLSQPMPSNCK